MSRRRRSSVYRDSLVGLDLKILELNKEEQDRVEEMYAIILNNLSEAAGMIRQQKGKKILDMKSFNDCMKEKDYKFMFQVITKVMHKQFNLVLENFVTAKQEKKLNKSFAKEAMVLEALEGLIQKDLLTTGSNLRLLLCNQLYEEKRSFLKKIFFNPKTDLEKMEPLIQKLVGYVFTSASEYVEKSTQTILKPRTRSKLMQTTSLKF